MVNSLTKKEYAREWYLKNFTKIKAKYQSPNGIKQNRINSWRHIGVISDNYDLLYEFYSTVENCEKCQKVLTTGVRNTHSTKMLDHNHETGEFRFVLCMACNSNDRVDNKSGVPNVSYVECEKKWRYSRTTNGILHSKRFNLKSDAFLYKYNYESTL